MSSGASGFDMRAACLSSVEILPMSRVLIETGLCFEIPCGYEVQIRPRSGLAIKSGVTVLNSPGTIDADYRGEVKIILINLGAQPYTVHRGDRIAQAVPAPVAYTAVLCEEIELSHTERHEGGFGSSGR